jgi:hypothetical protein
MAAPQTAYGGGLVAGFANVGRYFQLVSVVPATVVVTSTYALVAAGAPRSRPSWEKLGSGLAAVDLTRAGALGLAVVIVGMLMHPFQFATTQFLEGYWGPSPLARVAMFSRARIHADRRRRFLSGLAGATLDAEAAATQRAEAQTDVGKFWSAEVRLLRASLEYTAFEAAADRYPEEVERLMPTRLGNILRRHEDLAGRAHGLEALGAVPRLMAVAPPDQVAHVNDARSELDLAIRFVLSWLLVGITTFLLLWPYGPWLLVPIAAYGLAWLSYRGAVHAATEYGLALYVLIDLNHELLATEPSKLIVAGRRSTSG